MKNNFVTHHAHQIEQKINPSIDIILIGAGIMSVTLSTFLNILKPYWIIHIYERLHSPAQESSNAWNNAGTGHAAFCELNYTTYNNKNNSINIEKALTINSSFELSLQFWAYLIQENFLEDPKSFIRNVPHISFVWGEENISFLRKRFQELKKSTFFNGMIYSEDSQEIKSWIPLIMQGRNKKQKVAATYMEMGTDINFEEITQQLLKKLQKNPNFKIYFQHEVKKIRSKHENNWNLSILDKKNNQMKHISTKNVFIGAGGKSINLLQTSNIPEINGYAGFPVGGQFLVTYNSKIVSQHSAKVYGKADINTPPMSTPHIDTRILNTHKILLFGPFATFSSKFLKYGSRLDLLHSLNKSNLIPIMQAGIDNLPLIKYLINQLTMSNAERINTLKKYYPEANSKDWLLLQAGQRVQIIKKNKKNRGILQFGTEIIHSNDGSLSALLGASPGASTSVSIAIKLLNIILQNNLYNNTYQKKIETIIPSYQQYINNKYFKSNEKIRKKIRDILQLIYID